MRLSKLSIRNFRNFRAVDIPLSDNVVLLGENRVGKSNLLFAIRLILDPTLPDSARQLKLSDFWDGAPPDYSEPIEVHLEIVDFETDLGLLALLTDFRTAGDPTIARLSYIFRKKADVIGIPQSSDDCEFVVFGGGDEARSVPSKVRRRIAIDVLDALRDAEGQLGTWRSSPLRPLLEDAIAGVTRADLDAVAAELDKATKTLEGFPSVRALEDELRAGILHLSGKAHDINARLRFAPSDPPTALSGYRDVHRRREAGHRRGEPWICQCRFAGAEAGRVRLAPEEERAQFLGSVHCGAGGSPPSAATAFGFQKAVRQCRCCASIDRHQPFANAGCRCATAVGYSAENT
jgi:hypothetical protein